MKQYNFFLIAVLSSILLIGTTGCEDFLTKDHPTATKRIRAMPFMAESRTWWG